MNGLIGFFIKVGFRHDQTGEAGLNLAKIFNEHLMGEKGIRSLCDTLQPLKYGKDIDLILFHCHLKPSHDEIQIYENKISFKKKEKAIGISFIFDEGNFFSHSPDLRIQFLKKTLCDKLGLLENRIKSKKIDLDVARLKGDLSAILDAS